MKDRNRPMPLSELPAYMDSVRERGQGDDIPVVDMGVIVDSVPSRWPRVLAYSSVAFLFMVVGAVGYAVTKTESILIDAKGLGAQSVADIVSEGGGVVLSVNRENDSDYRVRVFTFKKMGSFLDGLRGKDEFRKVEIDDGSDGGGR